MREAAENKSATTFTGRRQGKMEQWVALWPIFEVCARETGYGGEGAGGMRGGSMRLWRHSSGQHWRKYHGDPGGDNRMKVTRSRGREGDSGDR